MIKNVNEIGVTETYDPCFDYSWVDNLRPVNIIITKSLTDKMIDTLLTEDCMKSCILHLTVTGWGGSWVEPGVGGYKWSKKQFDKLIDKGFDYNKCILRLDPIIPTEHGLYLANEVLTEFKNSFIFTVRVSVLDMYSHVKDRMGDKAPYSSFHAPDYMMDNVNKLLNKWSNIYSFESCAEPKLITAKKIGCVSKADIDIIKPSTEVSIIGSSRQRSTCLCPSNKVNIIKRKPGRCPHKCIYCYWKD